MCTGFNWLAIHTLLRWLLFHYLVARNLFIWTTTLCWKKDSPHPNVCGVRSVSKFISHVRQFWNSIKINCVLTGDVTGRGNFYVVPKIYRVVRPSKGWFKRNPRQVRTSSRGIWSRKLENVLLMRWDLHPSLAVSVHDSNTSISVFQNSPYSWIKNLPSGCVTVVVIPTAYATYMLQACFLCKCTWLLGILH
jgi:hypothetical protein